MVMAMVEGLEGGGGKSWDTYHEEK